MKLLIIGNGFDLAHGLPTKYGHFIYFAHRFLQIHTEPHDTRRAMKSLNEIADDRIDQFVNELLVERKHGDDVVEELFSELADNKWLIHFRFAQTGTKWLDFENEISSVVRLMEEFHHDLKDNIKAGIDDCELDEYHYDRLRFIFNNGKEYSEKEYIGIAEKLLTDLNNITRALEIYLDLFINHLPIQMNIDIFERFYPYYVLSFNYTNTYERCYKNNTMCKEYDYIHGKADASRAPEQCNLIIGIDEYLDDYNKNKDVDFVEYKKYFQRIHKKTGCNYKKWYEQFKELPEGYRGNYIHDAHIFGHSLSVFDGDVLSEIIRDKGTKVTIYYTDKNAYKD